MADRDSSATPSRARGRRKTSRKNINPVPSPSPPAAVPIPQNPVLQIGHCRLTRQALHDLLRADRDALWLRGRSLFTDFHRRGLIQASRLISEHMEALRRATGL